MQKAPSAPISCPFFLLPFISTLFCRRRQGEAALRDVAPRWLLSILMAAFPLVCSSGTPLVSPVFVKHAEGWRRGWGVFCKVVSQPGIPKTVIALTLSGTSVIEIRVKRRCLLCHCVHRACRDITSFLNGRWRLMVTRGWRLASCLIEFS